MVYNYYLSSRNIFMTTLITIFSQVNYFCSISEFPDIAMVFKILKGLIPGVRLTIKAYSVILYKGGSESHGAKLKKTPLSSHHFLDLRFFLLPMVLMSNLFSAMDLK